MNKWRYSDFLARLLSEKFSGRHGVLCFWTYTFGLLYLMTESSRKESTFLFSYKNDNDIQGGPERSRQSNLAVFTVESGLDSKFPCVK